MNVDGKKLYLSYDTDKNKITLSINIHTNTNDKKIILNTIINEKNKYITGLSHELKHAYDYFHERLMENSKILKERDTSVKSKREEKNWIDWTDVLKKREELKAKVMKFKDSPDLSPKQFTNLLNYLIVCLYSCNGGARRNKDFSAMYLTGRYKPSLLEEKEKNYYVLSTPKFIFNNYKTAKSDIRNENNREFDVDNKELLDAIELYLRHHQNQHCVRLY